MWTVRLLNRDQIHELIRRCKALFVHPQPKPSGSSTPNTSTGRAGAAGTGAGSGSSRAGGAGNRRIGTDENPIDMAYYDVLGLKAGCSTDEIKKAYRRMAIKVSVQYRLSCLKSKLTYSYIQIRIVMIQMLRRR